MCIQSGNKSVGNREGAKIVVDKGRPSTSQVITGRSSVTFCAGSSESDHSGVLPVKVRWSGM